MADHPPQVYEPVELGIAGEDTELIAADEGEADEAELSQRHIQLGYPAEARVRALPRHDAVLRANVLQRLEEAVGDKISSLNNLVFFKKTAMNGCKFR